MGIIRGLILNKENDFNYQNSSIKSLKRKIILFILAHTDDEAICLVGTIFKQTERDEQVFGISMADGVSARSDSSFSQKERR